MSSDEVQLINDWPPINSVPLPLIWSDAHSLAVRYLSTEEKVAVIRFPLVYEFRFGGPNDEALNGHPLYKNGLKFYSAHKVQNSTWIESLERSNSVHQRHDRVRFMEGKVHYILTFQDSTLECIAMEIRNSYPEVKSFAIEDESANRYWRSIVSNITE